MPNQNEPPPDESRSESEATPANNDVTRTIQNGVIGDDSELSVSGDPETLIDAASRSGAGKQQFPVIEGYEISGILGWGGMGIVYKARQVGLNRTVALKRIMGGAHARSDDILRFRTEAEAIGRLHHPNIVQVFEIGEADGHPYLSLEFVEGGTLADELRGVPQPPRAAARLSISLANAVHYAHSQDVAHRDLKPGNILLSDTASEVDAQTQRLSGSTASSGSDNQSRLMTCIPKVSDFGLAKQLDDDSGHTQTGSIIGTPSYMAPEQALGQARSIGPAVDVYALGAILYELLTGRPPFRGASAMETLEQVRTQEPVPPTQLQPGVPRDLETVCLKCLQKQPLRRYESAQELADDLQRFVNGEPILARPVSRPERMVRWCRRNPVRSTLTALATTAIVTVIVLATLFGLREKWHADQLGGALEDSEKHRHSAETRLAESYLERGLNLCEQAQVGRGMLWIAKALEVLPPDQVDLERVIRSNLAGWHAEESVLKVIIADQDPKRPAVYTPDGKFILSVLRNGKARLWDAQTGQPRSRPFPDEGSVDVILSPTGTQILTTDRDNGTALMWNIVPDGLSPPSQLNKRVARAAFNHDGSLLVTANLDLSVSVWEPNATDRALGSAKIGEEVRDVVFSPLSNVFLTVQGSTVQLWNGRAVTAVGATIRHEGVVQKAVFSPDGKALATAADDGQAGLWDAATGRMIGAPLRHGTAIRTVKFSPNGKTLVTGAGSRATRLDELYLWNVDDATVIHGPVSAREIRAFAFTPDSRMLITGSKDRRVHFWSTTSGEHEYDRHLHRNNVNVTLVSDDGKTLLTGDRDGDARLWDLATGKPECPPLQHLSSIYHAIFAKDGVHFLTQTSNEIHIWKRPVGLLQTSNDYVTDFPVRAITFSDSGKRFAVGGGADNQGGVVSGVVGQSTITELSNSLPIRVSCADFSHDEQILVVGGDKTPVEQGHPLRKGEVRLADLATAKFSDQFWEHNSPVVSIAFDEGANNFWTGSVRGLVQRWQINDNAPVANDIKHSGRVASLAVSRDGKSVVTGGGDRIARIWTADGQLVSEDLKHLDWVISAEFSDDGSLVITGSDDATARMWQSDTGQPIATPLRHKAAVSAVAFSHDQSIALTGSEDGTAQLWDVATGKRMGPAMLHRGDVLAVAFLPGDRGILTASRSESERGFSIHSWSLPARTEGSIEQIRVWTMVTTGKELAADGSMRLLRPSEWSDSNERLRESSR